MHSIEGYSIFQDSTGFAYDIILTRTDEVLEKDEKYTLKVGVPILPYVRINRTRVPLPRPLAQRLQLYATGEEPRVHACYMTYSAPIYGSKTETVAPLASTFSTAVGAFKRMFRLKTQKDWDARLKDDKYEFTAFRYDVPMKGPIGLIPLDPKEPVAPATASEQITDADNLEGIAAETFEGFADPILGLEEMNQDEDMEGVTSSAAAESKHDAPVDDYLEPSSKDYYLPEPFTDAFGRPMEFDITKIMKRHGGEDDADKATGDGEKDEREEKAPGDGEGSDAEEGVIGDEHQ